MSRFFDDQRDDGDADVRAALRQAVAGVQPEGGLERIEERLGEQARGSGLKVVIGTIAAVLATALVIGGVSWLNHEAKKPKPAPSSGRDVTVHAYYLGPTAGGLRLFSEQRTLHDVRTSDLQAAVSAALGTPEDPDYKPFPGSPQATVSSEGDVVVVDFNQPSLASYPLLSDLDAGMAIQALVWTVNDTVQRPVQVRFEINGQPARSLFGKVLNVSKDRLMDEASKQPYFLAQIKVDVLDIPAEYRSKLTPGLNVEIIMPTGERTVLAYLVEPLRETLRKTFREK